MANLNQMEIFYVVATKNSFSKAANELGMSKSFISAQISELEASLKVKLLNRNTRFIGLTEEGQLFYISCSKIMQEKQLAHSLISGEFTEASGILKVSAPPALASITLSDLLPEYQRLNPKVTLVIESSIHLQNLAKHGIDIALRVTNTPDQNYIARKITSIRVIICATQSYLDKYGYPKTPEDLYNHNCIGYTTDPHKYYWPVKGTPPIHLKIAGTLTTENSLIIKNTLMASIGIARLPAFVVEKELAAKEVIELFEQEMSEEIDLYALYQPNIRIPCKIKSFITFLKERLGSNPDHGISHILQSD